MKKISFIAASLVMIFTSCQKTPDACIETSSNEFVVGESVTFKSCSNDADKLVWDFGDDNEKTGEEVAYTFEKEGTYLVNLTATSRNENKVDKISKLIRVGNRYVSKIEVKSYPLTKSSGDQWDQGITTPSIPGIPGGGGGGFEITPSSGPDIAISFSLADGQFVNRTINMFDVTPSMLPLSWDASSLNVALTNEDWVIRMIDIDGEGFETMASWTANPTSVVGEGSFTLTNTSNPTGAAEVVIHYEIK